MKIFNNVEIGKLDSNGISLFNGDTIRVDVCKGVSHVGIIIYENMSFCLKSPRNEIDLFNVIPLGNYAPYCKITKI